MYSVENLNENDKKNLNAFGDSLFKKYKDENDNLSDEDKELIEKLLDNYGLLCVYACQDKFKDFFYYNGDENEGFRNPDIARQLILGYID